MSRDRIKGKRNPSGLCAICGEEIINKCRSSLYCFRCCRIKDNIENSLGGRLRKYVKKLLEEKK